MRPPLVDIIRFDPLRIDISLSFKTHILDRSFYTIIEMFRYAFQRIRDLMHYFISMDYFTYLLLVFLKFKKKNYNNNHHFCSFD